MKKNFSLNFDNRHLKRFDSTCWGSPCDAGESACLDFFTSSADSCKDQRDLGAPSKGQRFKQIRFLLGGDVVFALTKVPCLYTFRLFCHLPHDNVHHLTRVHVSGVCSLSAALKPGRKEKSPVFSDLSTDGRLCTWSCCSRLKDGFFFSLLRPVKSLILSRAGTAVIEGQSGERLRNGSPYTAVTPSVRELHTHSFSDVSDLNLLCVTVLVWTSVGWEADGHCTERFSWAWVQILDFIFFTHNSLEVHIKSRNTFFNCGILLNILMWYLKILHLKFWGFSFFKLTFHPHL